MTAINQKEYLKKYLSGKKDKKKRKKKSAVTDRVNIIDDDIDISTLNSLEAAADLLNTNEDAPQVVGVIDDRPMHLRINDYRNELWKPLAAQDHSDEDTSQPREVGERIKISISNIKHENRKDESPPRKAKKKRVSRFEQSPPRGRDSDSSPLRKQDNSPPRRSRKESDSSPPRKSRRDSDNSPPRKQDDSRKESPQRSRRTSDSSPPRRNRKKSDGTPDNSPPRRSRKNSDSSPPRRNKKDTSPPTKRNTDPSPPRRRKKTRFDTDNSPPRIHIKQERESPPPQPSSSKPFEPPPRKLLPGNAKGKYLIPAKRMTKTLDGKIAGLQNKHELVRENERFVLRETEVFQNMPAEISGVNATPILRDRKTGKIRDLQAEAEERKEKEKIEEQNKEKYSRWGKGLKQVAAYEDKLTEDLHEMNKPLARYADDEDLERYLMEQEREGDPMLAYIRKKKKKKVVESGKPLKPQYEGEFNPNRFGIVPGYRWDGVDRSNGYEKKWFEVQNAKRAQQEEIYKWSTEDM